MFPQETIKKKAAKAEPLAEFEDSLRILDGSTADHGWNISIAWSVDFFTIDREYFCNICGYHWNIYHWPKMNKLI